MPAGTCTRGNVQLNVVLLQAVRHFTVPLCYLAFYGHFSPVSQDSSCLLPSTDGRGTFGTHDGLAGRYTGHRAILSTGRFRAEWTLSHKKPGAPREFHVLPNRHSDCSVIPSVDPLPLLPANDPT